jgi:Acetyltransferase (GNAT) domain
MRTGYRCEILPESRYDEWLKFVAASPEGSIYAAPDYLAALSRADGGRFVLLGVRFGEELVGGVALYEKDSRFGSYVSPRPLLYYNGILLRRYDTRYPSERTARHIKTLEELESALVKRNYAFLTLASPSSMTDVRTFTAAGWHAQPRYSYVVDIGDLDSLWARTEQNLRRLVKRCEREGITFHQQGDFDAFFRLHTSIMDRREHGHYLSEAAFRGFFQELHAASLCQLYEARNSAGKAIAGQLVLLGPSPVCHIAAAAADQQFQSSGVSAFLRWKSFEALSALGHTAVDLTDAALNPVTHFKSQLGGELKMTLALHAPQRLAHRLITGARGVIMRLRTGLRASSTRSHR